MSAGGRSSRAAAASGPRSGPGATPSRANALACSGASASSDHDSTVGRLAVGSSSARAWSPASRSSPASTLNGRSGRSWARAATMPSASGNPPQKAISRSAAADSAVVRAAPKPAGEQQAGFVLGQDVEAEVVGRVPGDQSGELGAAGHQDGAGVPARQQRGDLGGVRGVVQHEQHPCGR